MISKVDYHQVFEETVMSVVEGLVSHADKAGIKDLKQILSKWCDFYQHKIKSSNNKYTVQASHKLKKLAENQKSLTPEMVGLINENFWELF
jgi:hypothetical protein